MLIFILCNINRKISKLSILIYKITKKKNKKIFYDLYIHFKSLFDLGKRNKLFRIEIFFSSAQPFPFFFLPKYIHLLQMVIWQTTFLYFYYISC